MPRPDDSAKERFRSLVPDDPRISTRPMFGNLAAFVNGNMFMGLFGNDMFVRLPDAEREELLHEGGSDFEPMPGRPMREYAVLPGEWGRSPARAEAWVARSLAWASGLPPKLKPSKGR